MKNIVLFITVLQQIAIIHCYLNIDSIEYPDHADIEMREKYDGINMTFELAEVFEELTDVTFGSVSSRLLKWDLQYYNEFGGDFWTGSVVMVPTEYAFPEMIPIMSLDARAVIYGTILAGAGQLSLTKGATARDSGWDTLTFQISEQQSANVVLLWKFLEIGGSINVTVDGQNNFNSWSTFADSFTMFIIQTVLCVYSVFVVLVCMYKLFYVLQNNRNIPVWKSLPKSVLIAELVVGIFRILYFMYDPVSIRRFTTAEVSYYLAQVTAPISISTTIGVLIHWNKITAYSVKTFKRWKTIIIVFIGIFVFVGIVVFGIAPTFIDPIISTYGSSAFYLITTIILAIYTFITIPNILKVIKKHPQRKMLIEKTLLIGISGLLTVLWCFPPILFLFSSTALGHIWLTVWMIWFFLLDSISLAQILVFSSKKSKRRSVVNLSNKNTASMDKNSKPSR